MQVTYQLTPDDFYQGMLVWRSRRKWQQWVRWIAYIAVILVLLMGVLLLLLNRNTDPGKVRSACVAILFAGVWLAVMWGGPWLSLRRQFRNHPVSQSPMTLNTSEAGLEFHNPHVDSKVAWSAYVGWGEGKSVFVVMPQPRIFIVIPKRAFTEEQVGEFREMLRRNIVQK
jgi:hypothetical protein